MALNTFCFCMLVAFIFWVATMGDKAKAAQAGTPKGGLAPGAIPALAGGSQALDKQS
jgi:cytochrome bd ubiquinol oxidase subunit I